MRILRAETHRAMRWRNGGGVTYEVASFPAPDAALDGFDWRVSMARVETDGPFSLFPGIDRSLAIVEGEGLRLTIGDAPEIEIVSGSEPHLFAADVPTNSRLIAGPVTDLNVMTRRGAWRHRVTRMDVGGTARMDALADVTLLVVRNRTVSVSDGATRETLGVKDAVVLEAPIASVVLESELSAQVFRVDLWHSTD